MFSIDEGEAESFFGQRGLKMIDLLYEKESISPMCHRVEP